MSEYENYSVSNRRGSYQQRPHASRGFNRPPYQQDRYDSSEPTASTSSATDAPPPSKKRRFPPRNKPSGGASSAPKVPDVPTGILVQPRLRYFTIFCSNFGVSDLSRVMFQTILGRDARMAATITQLQCEYVLTIAYINRLVQCGLELGYSYIQGSSDLKTISKGIELPHTLVRYIEALGQLKLSNGTTVVPWVQDYRAMFPAGNLMMRDPLVILQEANRPALPDGWIWPIDRQWILDWNLNTTRPSRLGFKFSKVGDSFDGRAEMVCSYGTVLGDITKLQSYTPQVITDAEAQLGAAYRFRDIDETALWLGGTAELVFHSCVGSSFEPDVLLAEHTTRSLVQ